MGRPGGWRRAALLAALEVAGLAGCLHKPPRAVSGLQEELDRALDRCIEEYAPEAARRAADAVVRAEREGRSWHRVRVRRLASEAQEAIRAAETEAAARQEEARVAASGAIDQSSAVVEESSALAGTPGAGDGWRRELNRAQTLLDDARRMLDFHPCEYPKAEAVARDAEVAARASLAEADAERDALAEAERAKIRDAAALREQARRKAGEAGARRRKEWQGAVEPVARWGVAQGECLWRIAADPRVFGDPFRWPLIWHANRLQIGDPDLIFPGQSFVVPRDVSPVEIARAVQEARSRVWPTPNYLRDGK